MSLILATLIKLQKCVCCGDKYHSKKTVTTFVLYSTKNITQNINPNKICDITQDIEPDYIYNEYKIQKNLTILEIISRG